MNRTETANKLDFFRQVWMCYHTPARATEVTILQHFINKFINLILLLLLLLTDRRRKADIIYTYFKITITVQSVKYDAIIIGTNMCHNA